MNEFEFNDKIKFLLPDSFVITKNKNEDDKEEININTGEYIDELGEAKYNFSCRIDLTDVNPEVGLNNLFNINGEKPSNFKFIKISERPQTVIGNVGIQMPLLFNIVGMMMTSAYVLIKKSQALSFNIINSVINGEGSNKHYEVCENLYEILKSCRINGEPIEIDNITPSEIENAIRLKFETIDDYEEEDESSMSFFDYLEDEDDEIFDNNYPFNDFEDEDTEEFRKVYPDELLYPHYKNHMNDGLSLFPVPVMRSSGTDYTLMKFSDLIKSWKVHPEMEERKQLFQKILEINPSEYTLGKTAREMIKIFRVNKEIFMSSNDREVELLNGYMRSAYMMSALRSFAWTLADYCKSNDKTPETIDESIPSRIADFVARRKWLNYEDKSYCNGLCSGSDLHVYFISDLVSSTDKSKLLPSQEDYERVEDIRKTFPAYEVLFSEVNSIESLRSDLEYIYPAIEIFYNKFIENRDHSKPLEGNEADILYTWISLSIAAEEPFFIEDGPMGYGLGWPGEEEERKAILAKQAKENAEKILKNFGNYIEKNPEINFDGKKFVFSGRPELLPIDKDPLIQKVVEKGGLYRKKVSGVTNYLVVNPLYADESYIIEAIEQNKKGKKIKIILEEDLENILEGKTSVSNPYYDANTELDKENIVNAEYAKDSNVLNFNFDKDFNIDSTGKLTAYYGSDKEIVLPSGIKSIGEEAFLRNENITSVVIPEGVEVIENGAFWMCYNLESVTLPNTIKKIGDNAFNSCEKLTIIIIPDGCNEIGIDCFIGCQNLKNIHVSDSVNNIGKDAFFTFCRDMVIHTIKDSAVEKMANDYDWKVDYKYLEVDYEDNYSNNSDTTNQNHNQTNNENLIKNSSMKPLEHTEDSSSATRNTSNQSNRNSGGCYIATAVYGSYDSPQVMTLRRFRDETLRDSAFGRWFIRMYYKYSPPVAEKLKNAKYINKLVRSILDVWVKRLDRM